MTAIVPRGGQAVRGPLMRFTSHIFRLAAAMTVVAPADAAYFQRQQTTFETKSLARYSELIAQVKARYAGTPAGASESIVSPLADTLGLRMLTPYSFLR